MIWIDGLLRNSAQRENSNEEEEYDSHSPKCKKMNGIQYFTHPKLTI
jgi:hypothetical protein